MTSRLSIGDLPDRYQRQIYKQLQNGKPIGIARSKQVSETPIELGKRIRQCGRKPNKTESAFAKYLSATTGTDVLEQAITLRIANGCRYTPDIIVALPTLSDPGARHAHQITAYEVKGPHAWDDAIVKLKVAASQFPWIRFVLVTKTSSGVWRQEGVLP